MCSLPGFSVRGTPRTPVAIGTKPSWQMKKTMKNEFKILVDVNNLTLRIKYLDDEINL